jgi:hypothetical protein
MFSSHSDAIKTMIRRFSIAPSAAVLGAALCVYAPPASAQGRGGMSGAAARGSGSSSHPRGSSSHPSGMEGGTAEGRRFLNGYPYWFPYFYPWDDYDDDYAQPPPPEAAPGPPTAAGAFISAPRSAPVAPPAAPLLLEMQNGQWVRIPTGNEIPAGVQTSTAGSAPPGYVGLPQVNAPAAPLPHAVIVYRDGHTEELAKYMIQGTDLYTPSDYYSTGTWTRKISLSQLDIPASLKLNKERGTKFTLPSSPNEVVVRF